MKTVRRLVDIGVMFVAAWLLTSMSVDVITPKELTVYVIGATTAPSMLMAAIVYSLKYPVIDFVVVVSALWIVEAIALAMISRAPLPSYLVWIGLAVPAGIGILVGFFWGQRP